MPGTRGERRTYADGHALDTFHLPSALTLDADAVLAYNDRLVEATSALRIEELASKADITTDPTTPPMPLAFPPTADS